MVPIVVEAVAGIAQDTDMDRADSRELAVEDAERVCRNHYAQVVHLGEALLVAPVVEQTGGSWLCKPEKREQAQLRNYESRYLSNLTMQSHNEDDERPESQRSTPSTSNIRRRVSSIVNAR